MTMESETKVNDVQALAALRLGLVETSGVGPDLVSLTHRLVVASGDDLSCDDSVPVLKVGEVEEQEACEMAEVDKGEGWPGWEILLPWLNWKVTTAELGI